MDPPPEADGCLVPSSTVLLLAERLRSIVRTAVTGPWAAHDPSSAAAIEADTRTMTHFAVRCSLSAESCGKKVTAVCPRTATEASLAVCIRRMHVKHALLFRSMMVRLRIHPQVDFDAGFAELAADLFGDEVNWSKIVALYAFGARLGMRGIIVKYIFSPILSKIGWAQFEIFRAANLLFAREFFKR